MLSNDIGRKLCKYVKDYVVFDLETTGVSYKKDEVVEISAVKVMDGKVVDEFTTLVNPGCPIPERASEINGIYDDMVKDAPSFDKALGDFLEFIGDMILVGHNIHTFDMKFICRDAKKYFGQYVGNDYIDTLPFSRSVLPKLDYHTLVYLAEHYNINTEGAHRALNDCRMNQAVFEKLGEEIRNAEANAKICPKCGSLMKLRNGMYGEFYGCTGYPNCRYTTNV